MDQQRQTTKRLLAEQQGEWGGARPPLPTGEMP